MIRGRKRKEEDVFLMKRRKSREEVKEIQKYCEGQGSSILFRNLHRAVFQLFRTGFQHTREYERKAGNGWKGSILHQHLLLSVLEVQSPSTLPLLWGGVAQMNARENVRTNFAIRKKKSNIDGQ
jgi:hypothetical protein